MDETAGAAWLELLTEQGLTDIKAHLKDLIPRGPF